MAGHSHSKNVKRTKEADAKKRSLAFAKMGKQISFLVKRGGSDINSNPALRTMIEKSREINVPKENIEKAIKRGLGESEGSGTLEEFLFEGYGPGGIAILAEGITDNKNRSIAEFKKIISQHGGKVAEPGSVKWMFKRKGVVIAEGNNYNEAESTSIEMGAEDIRRVGQTLEIIADPENTDRIKKGLEASGFKAESFLKWVPSLPVDGDRKKAESLFQDLGSGEDIQEIYSNIKE